MVITLGFDPNNSGSNPDRTYFLHPPNPEFLPPNLNLHLNPFSPFSYCSVPTSASSLVPALLHWLRNGQYHTLHYLLQQITHIHDNPPPPNHKEGKTNKKKFPGALYKERKSLKKLLVLFFPNGGPFFICLYNRTWGAHLINRMHFQTGLIYL